MLEQELITIDDVAVALRVTYHTARRRLLRHAEAQKLRYKIGHTVLYKKEVMELLEELK